MSHFLIGCDTAAELSLHNVGDLICLMDLLIDIYPYIWSTQYIDNIIDE